MTWSCWWMAGMATLVNSSAIASGRLSTATTAAIDAAMPSICTQTGVFMERMAETMLMPWKTLPPGEFIRI